MLLFWYGLCGTMWGFDNDSCVGFKSMDSSRRVALQFKALWNVDTSLQAAYYVAQFAIGVGIFETNVLPAIQALKFRNPKLQIHVHFVS